MIVADNPDHNKTFHGVLGLQLLPFRTTISKLHYNVMFLAHLTYYHTSENSLSKNKWLSEQNHINNFKFKYILLLLLYKIYLIWINYEWAKKTSPHLFISSTTYHVILSVQRLLSWTHNVCCYKLHIIDQQVRSKAPYTYIWHNKAWYLSKQLNVKYDYSNSSLLAYNVSAEKNITHLSFGKR